MTKWLVFSDTHLNHKFDEDKFNFLQSLIANHDRVLINGDFWDYFETSFDRFVDSKWNQLFPLLKEKQAVYIHGNHDPEWLMDERVNLWSDEYTDKFSLKYGENNYLFEHGHVQVNAFDYFHPWAVNMVTKTLARQYYPFWKIFRGERIIERFKHQNEELKQWKQQQLGKEVILVTGHTHYPEESEQENYINTGWIRFGMGDYLVLENGEHRLIRDTY